jgi:hypothetical protein
MGRCDLDAPGAHRSIATTLLASAEARWQQRTTRLRIAESGEPRLTLVWVDLDRDAARRTAA